MVTLGLLNLYLDTHFSGKHWESDEVPCAFFVHSSIIYKWNKIMNKMFTNSDWEMYEHILQIGSKVFEMRLINVIRATKDQLNFLGDSIKNSQFSFPWEEKPTLFIYAANFYIMKKFIKDFNLEAYISKLEENMGHSVNGNHIIVVSFHESVNAKLDIIQEFKKYSDWRYNLKDITFFMAFGFPWQQSYFLQKTRLNQDLYSTLPIILNHLGTLNYVNDLDILDLLSLRLAISDVRDPTKLNLLKDEIDFMIKRVLAKLIKNNHLSIHKYLVAKNSPPSGLLMFYLVYEFQNFFQTIDMLPVGKTSLNDVIKLKEEFDVVNKLKDSLNVDYRIDGMGFDKMSLPLFVDLIESGNVYEIYLDTNYRWLNNLPMFELNRIISAFKEVKVDIYLRGGNTYNFTEGFAQELKAITFDNFELVFHIYKCNLNDYRIFDNLPISDVDIYDLKIDSNMLDNLEQCDIEPRIFLYDCSLEYTCRNWQILNNLEKLSVVEISEDEGTWLSIFEFILNEIRKSNTNEFRFNSKSKFEISQLLYPFTRIDLNKIKFTIDEQYSKLEVHDVETNEIVDLYCSKCKIEEEEKSDYEFYQ